MKRYSNSGVLAALAAAVLFHGPALAGSATPEINKQSSFHAVPINVTVRPTATGTHVQGEMRRLPGSPSRRLYGDARIEGIGADGETLFVVYADLDRAGSARHTNRADFAAGIPAVPVDDIEVINIGYVIATVRR